jgi:hypothetical protein
MLMLHEIFKTDRDSIHSPAPLIISAWEKGQAKWDFGLWRQLKPIFPRDACGSKEASELELEMGSAVQRPDADLKAVMKIRPKYVAA